MIEKKKFNLHGLSCRVHSFAKEFTNSMT